MEKYRYREAMPRLDVVKAKAAFNRHQIVCRYFDERDNQVGEAFVRYWSDGGLGIEFSGDCFEQSAASAGWTGWADFSTVVAAKKNNSGKARMYLACHGCRKAVGILIYKGRWACGDCLKLGYRSQFVPPEVFDGLKLAALQQKIGAGRPKGMRQATFRKAQNDLAVLKKKSAGSFPSVASVAHQRVIRATWMTPAEAGHLAHPDYEIVDGEIVRGRPPHVERDNQPPTLPAVANPPVAEPKPLRFDPRAFEMPETKSYWSD